MKRQVSSEAYKGNNSLLIGICLAVSTYWLFTTATGIILPSVSESLKVSQNSLITPASLAGLFSGSFIVVAGKFADRYGRKRLTEIGLLFNILGCLCLVLAPNVFVFSAGRVFQGVSASMIMPATLSLIQVYYHGMKKQRAISYWSISSWGGAGLSNILVGLITTIINWQMVFLCSILFTLISLLLLRRVPESQSKTSGKGIDVIGLFLLITDLVSLNVLTTHVATFGWISLPTILLFLYVILSTFYLIKVESKMKDKAVLDLSIFKNKLFNSCTVSNFLLNLAAGCTFVYVSFLQNKFHLSAMDSGFLTLGYLVTVVIFVLVGEKMLVVKNESRLPMLLGTGITFIGIFLVSITTLPEVMYFIVSFIGLSIMGIGLGLYATPSTSTALENLAVSKSAAGSGIYKMASSLGGSFGVAISGALYGLSDSLGYTKAAQIAMTAVYISAILSFITVYFFVPKKIQDDSQGQH